MSAAYALQKQESEELAKKRVEDQVSGGAGASSCATYLVLMVPRVISCVKVRS